MIKNYFTIAWRNLLNNKIISAIKIGGLGVGLTVCLLIFLYSKDELSFDRFHSNKENIYRVIQHMRITGQPPAELGTTQRPLGETFANEIPEVKARVRMLGIPVTLKLENEMFLENPLSADDNFFSVFNFDLLEGNPKTALRDMHSIVLTQSTAKKYFGKNNPIGKIIQLKKRDEFENFTVTAVAADPPQNSTITFTMLVPFSYFEKGYTHKGWIGGSLNTFLVLDPSESPVGVIPKMQQIFNKNTKEQIARAEQEQQIKVEISLGLQQLDDIHLNKELGANNGLAEVSSPAYSYVLTSIAIFILLIACINFVNLSIGQSLKRSREIGIRKVVGGTRGQLIRQFLVESFLVSLCAFIFALVLATAILPLFNDLSGKKLSLTYLADGWLYLGWFAILIVTSLLAGLYPSLVLSGFQPLKTLAGKQKLMGKGYFARGLIVFQFTLAIFLIIGTIAIYTQLNFLFSRNLGYESSNLVKIDLPFSDENGKLVARFKKELSGQPGIVSIAARNGGRWRSGARADGKLIEIDLNSIDENFFPTFKIGLKEGRNFSSDFPGDSATSAIVNETFVKLAGWHGNAIGKTIESVEVRGKLTIIGVIKDYHYGSLKEELGAQVFMLGPEKEYGQIWVKLHPANVPATLGALSETFRSLSPFYPYTYAFMETINARQYESEIKWKRIIGISTILFLFISCIGLLGLVMLSVEQRTKEIGVRKVLGAAATRIFFIISKQFTVLVLIAFVVAIPLSYYAIHRWLMDFPYRTPIHWWMFAMAGLIVVSLALFTISFQAIRAARENPAKSLRSE